MNLLQFKNSLKPRKPYVMGNSTSNKYNKTSLDGHRVLPNGSIVVRTVSVGGVKVSDNYDADMKKIYNQKMKAYKENFKG